MKGKTIAILLSLSLLCAHASAASLVADTTTVSEVPKAKKSFGQKLLQPIKWIARNWSAYDPRYSTPSFYNWSFQLENTTSQEWMELDNDLVRVKMRSKVSNRFGPYFGWRWIFYGFTVDLNASNIFKGNKRKNELTLAINSNLFNIDLIRRRTGGDFTLREVTTYDQAQPFDTYWANNYGVGDQIKYGIDGININYFTNHKKYSNSAAFSNGAIQLRSVGSPIVGLGFTHQHLESTLGNMFVDRLAQAAGGSIQSADDYLSYIPDDINDFGLYMNSMPSNVTINDLHLQLGYAYNIVFSRRLLLGLSLVMSPGVKWTRFDNKGTYMWEYANEFVDLYNTLASLVPEEELDGAPSEIHVSDLRYDETTRNLGFDVFSRASLVYNHNRWRFGVGATFSSLLYKYKEARFDNYYGNVIAYAGYCFGRKKQYRYDGDRREAYITAALTKSQIAEMKDTMPASNIDREHGDSEKRTRYHRDVFDIDIHGCDLVQGPDGDYGTFEITSGYITEGQDSEGRLRSGMVLKLNESGNLVIEAGHKKSFRAGNWWKSQLDVRQTPINWYPEMLHYALKGKLTCYVRSHTFGTMQPVKMEIDGFCICHGSETKEFFMIGAEKFFSHSSYSITGELGLNGRLCRVYIEAKKHGKKMSVYVNRLKSSSLQWMRYLPDTRPISKVSMPGTHDAGTASLPENTITSMGHTQNFTVTEQLHDGIRAFDIRLKKNMKYGHTMMCRDGFDESMADIRTFLREHPSEFIVAMVGSDEGGKWDAEITSNYKALIAQYADLFVEDFDASTPVGDVRGKVLVIKRQEACPFGKLLKFEDNAIFSYDCFDVEDVYKEHKTYKKIGLVGTHLRNAYENEDPKKWYITFNSIAWDPRHHKPYYSAWGARNVRKPMNISLRELIEEKEYTNFGMVFLDFYNDHGDKPQLTDAIIRSNFVANSDEDYIRFED